MKPKVEIKSRLSSIEAIDAQLMQLADYLYPEMELRKAQDRLHAACRYTLLSPGKRIRPRLAMLCAESLLESGDPAARAALPAALALEMIHAYSLAHDDLPAMDNDLLRRGLPTTHAAFGEALGILAGDALLTDAFRVLTDDSLHETLGCPYPAPLERLEQTKILSLAAGGVGMVFGQSLDLENLTEAPSQPTKQPASDLEALEQIHALKTGRLFAAACSMGCAALSTDKPMIAAFDAFGAKLGHAFQIVDDLLDPHASTGKSAGKDAASGKLTYLSALGAEQSARRAEALTDSALAHVLPYAMNADALVDLCRSLLQRLR